MNKSFEKMFDILELFSMDRTSLSISEIQKELGYPKSTIFRTLNTMQAYNYIQQNPDNQRYSLGFNFFRLGSIYQSQMDFRLIALPIMKDTMEKTSETVELNIIDGLNRICVEKVDSPLDVRNFVRIGDRKPVYLGASGKVLMAFQKEAEQKEIFDMLSREDVNIVNMKKDIQIIKQNGYALTKGERVPGSFAIATPIFDNKEDLVASLTIAGPIQRLSKERESQLISVLLMATKEICEKLGYFKFEFKG